MTQSPTASDPAPDRTARELIDAMLDEALAESFPASDSISIGSSIAAIKLEDRNRNDD